MALRWPRFLTIDHASKPFGVQADIWPPTPERALNWIKGGESLRQLNVSGERRRATACGQRGM